MQLEQIDRLWTIQKPTKPGFFRWRKDRKWEYITREVLERTDGTLIVYASRLENWVPLEVLDAGGSEWLVEDLVAAGCINPASKCIARKSIFRT